MGSENSNKGKESFQSFNLQIGLVIFLSTLVIYLITLNGVWATDHTTAFVEFDYAVWSRHSFVLGTMGDFNPKSVDVFLYSGNYYMANAPGAAFISLPFAIIGFILSGHFTLYGKVLLMSEVPVALANALTAYLVFKICGFYFNKRVSSFLAFTYAFSTISWPFATFLYQSDFAAMFDLVAVYFALRIGRMTKNFHVLSGGTGVQSELDRTTMALLSGLALSCAVMVDYVNATLIPIIGIYIVLKKSPGVEIPNRKRVISLIAFLVESIGLTLFLLSIYNYASFGNAFANSEQVYLNGSSVFGSFTFPFYEGMFLNLFTPQRGLFFYSPVLILGALGFWWMFRKKLYLGEAVLLLAIFLGIVVPYSSWYDVAGGLSFGPRFLIAAIPFLLIPAGFPLSRIKSKSSFVMVFVLYMAGVIQNGLDSLIGVLARPNINWLSSPFLYKVLPDLSSGSLDQWWSSRLGPNWSLAGSAILLFAMLFPIACTFLLRSKATQGSSN